MLPFTNAVGMKTEEKAVVHRPFGRSEKGADFVDAYIAAHAKANPPAAIVTWDQHFKQLDVRHDKPGNL